MIRYKPWENGLQKIKAKFKKTKRYAMYKISHEM